MTNKPTMPEPVAYWNKAVDHDCAAFSYAEGAGYDTPLITTAQAETYAAAKVREALESRNNQERKSDAVATGQGI